MADTLTMEEAWAISRELTAALEIPERATSRSIGAEWAAIDAALLERGIQNIRCDSYGQFPAGISPVLWMCQRADGHVTGRWGVLQAEVAIALSMHQDAGPLRWLVADQDHEISQRYFPTSRSSSNWRYQLTDGPVESPVPREQEGSLLAMLGDWQ